MRDSLTFFNKLKDYKDKNKNTSENEEISNDLESKINNNKNKNISKDMNSNKEKTYKLIYIDIIFIIIFGVLLLILYFLVFCVWIYLFNLLLKANNMNFFFFAFQNYQNQIFDMFNIYREYLFNDEIKILNIRPLEYLKKLEDQIYDLITEQIQKTEFFLVELMTSNKEIIPDLAMNSCDNYITDYFNSVEECINQFKNCNER